MTLLATTTELAIYIQSPVVSDTNNATDMPNDIAELLLTLASGLVLEVIATRAVYPETVKAIVLEAAARAYRNPGGHSSRSIDDSQESFNPSLAGGPVYLTGAEITRLRGLDGHAASAFTIRTLAPDPVPYWWPAPVPW